MQWQILIITFNIELTATLWSLSNIDKIVFIFHLFFVTRKKKEEKLANK